MTIGQIELLTDRARNRNDARTTDVKRLPLPVAPILIVIAALAGLAVLIWLLSSWFDDHYVPVAEDRTGLEPD